MTPAPGPLVGLACPEALCTTALVGWRAPLGARLPPLRPGVKLRDLGWADGRRLLRAHRYLLATLLLAGIAAGVAGAVTAPPRAAAETLLMVGEANSGAADPLQGDIALLHSDAVANRLVQQLGVAALFPDLTEPQWFGLGDTLAVADQMRLAAARAKTRITASAAQGPGMLRIGYADADPALALRALTVIVAAYRQLRANLGAGDVSGMIARDADQTDQQLRDIDAQIQKLRADYQIVDLDQDTASATARLDDIGRRESQVRQRQQAVAAELTAADSQLQSAPQRVFDAQEISAHPLEEARATVLALRLERDHLATQYTPTYPALVELDRKIATAQQSLQQSGKPVVSATRDVRNPALDQLRNRANDLRIEAAGLAHQLDALNADYAPAYARVTELREAETRMHDLQYRRGVLEAVGRQISVREISLRVEDSVAQARRAQVHVLQAPADAASGGLGWLWLAGGVAGGVAAAGVGGWLAMRLRPTYVLAREVEQHLGEPVLAEFHAGDPALLEPASLDQVAAIAAILADTQVEGRPFFALQAITPDADADQFTLVQALAAELGGRFGRRTLVLEVGADGVAAPIAFEGPGLGGELPARLAAACLPLWESADTEAGGTALALTPADGFTAQTLTNLRHSCDLVVITAGGAASDEASRRLAGFVDATLLVVAAEASPAARARALSDMVAAEGGQLLGVVMTGRSNQPTMW